jgi:hypothetical protein
MEHQTLLGYLIGVKSKGKLHLRLMPHPKAWGTLFYHRNSPGSGSSDSSLPLALGELHQWWPPVAYWPSHQVSLLTSWLFLVFFCGSVGQTQCLTNARQTYHHWATLQPCFLLLTSPLIKAPRRHINCSQVPTSRNSNNPVGMLSNLQSYGVLWIICFAKVLSTSFGTYRGYLGKPILHLRICAHITGFTNFIFSGQKTNSPNYYPHFLAL